MPLQPRERTHPPAVGLYVLEWSRTARRIRSDVAGIGRPVMPSGARASRIAFITAGVVATVPPSPAPLAPSRLVVLGTGLKSMVIAGSMSARGMP